MMMKNVSWASNQHIEIISVLKVAQSISHINMYFYITSTHQNKLSQFKLYFFKLYEITFLF